VADYLEGHPTQFGWIAKAYAAALKQELHGRLVSKGAIHLGVHL
jgi:hypothetical protein